MRETACEDRGSRPRSRLRGEGKKSSERERRSIFEVAERRVLYVVRKRKRSCHRKVLSDKEGGNAVGKSLYFCQTGEPFKVKHVGDLLSNKLR